MQHTWLHASLCCPGHLALFSPSQGSSQPCHRFLQTAFLPLLSFSLSHSFNQLSGFELCETESSIKRKGKKNWKQVSMLAYVAPENMKDSNYPYKRPCEIYRCVCPSWERCP